MTIGFTLFYYLRSRAKRISSDETTKPVEKVFHKNNPLIPAEEVIKNPDDVSNYTEAVKEVQNLQLESVHAAIEQAVEYPQDPPNQLGANVEKDKEVDPPLNPPINNEMNSKSVCNLLQAKKFYHALKEHPLSYYAKDREEFLLLQRVCARQFIPSLDECVDARMRGRGRTRMPLAKSFLVHFFYKGAYPLSKNTEADRDTKEQILLIFMILVPI